MTKTQLRGTCIARQKNLLPDDRSAKSRMIARSFFQNFDLNRIGFLHCFISIEKFNEIDTKFIFQTIWRQYPDVQVLVPRVDFEENEIRNVRFRRDTLLKRNSWDIDEPEGSEFVDAEKIDIVIVPGLAFDRRGHRVGYGKGFYDRFLNRCRPDCVKIGLNYFEPIGEIDDVHEGDVRVDFVITPEGLFKAN